MGGEAEGKKCINMSTDNIDINPLTSRFTKQLAIYKATINGAVNAMNLIKQLPRSGKRNPFVKTYNRRPRNKQKRSVLFAQMSINAALTAMEITTIASQPLRKVSAG